MATTPLPAPWVPEDAWLFTVVLPAFERATDSSPALKVYLDNPTMATLTPIAALAQMLQGDQELADLLPLTSQVVLYSYVSLVARAKVDRGLMERSSAWLEDAIYQLGWHDLLEGM